MFAVIDSNESHYIGTRGSSVMFRNVHEAIATAERLLPAERAPEGEIP
jgi:hypothetical protein